MDSRAREESPESLRFNFLKALDEDEGLVEGSIDGKAAILAIPKDFLGYCPLRVAQGNMVLACRLLAYCKKTHRSDSGQFNLTDFSLGGICFSSNILLFRLPSGASRHSLTVCMMGRCSMPSLFNLACLFTLARAIPNPLPLPTTLFENSLSSNLPNSTLNAVIPNDFTIQPTAPLDEPVLNQQYTLLLTLGALGNLALDDFLQPQQSQTWRSLQHVALDIVGPSLAVESPIPMRKYAMWGIYKAAHLMAASNDFRARNYKLFWQRTLVGYISFNNGEPGALAIGSGQANATAAAVQQRDLSILPNSLPNATAIDPDNTHTSLSFELHGRSIGESNVFMTLFTAMLKAAPYSKTERVDKFLVNTRTFNTFLSFKGQDEAGPGEPVLVYEHLIQLFVKFPTWVLQHGGGRWLEADMVVAVDGKVVGAGVLKWQARNEVGAVDGGDVVTS